MKNYVFSVLLIFTCTLSICAQHKGNYNQISRQNVLHSGNATIYNPTVQQQINKVLNPSTHVFIDVKALQNVEATTYTAIFNISQIGPTADSTNLLINQRIDKIKNQLKSIGITDDDFAVDVISFVPNYEIEVQKKLFSKTYTEVPNGFELQQNLHIQFTKTNQFETILTACANSEIYNLVKVDYYIENIAEVYKNLQTKLLKLIEEKKAYYKILGFDLVDYNVAIDGRAHV